MNIHRDDPKWTAYVLGELAEAERSPHRSLAVTNRDLRTAGRGFGAPLSPLTDLDCWQ